MNGTTHRGALVAGALFIVAGVAFLLEAFEVFSLAPGVIWPLIVVGFGLAIALGGGRPSGGDT